MEANKTVGISPSRAVPPEVESIPVLLGHLEQPTPDRVPVITSICYIPASSHTEGQLPPCRCLTFNLGHPAGLTSLPDCSGRMETGLKHGFECVEPFRTAGTRPAQDLNPIPERLDLLWPKAPGVSLTPIGPCVGELNYLSPVLFQAIQDDPVDLGKLALGEFPKADGNRFAGPVLIPPGIIVRPFKNVPNL